MPGRPLRIYETGERYGRLVVTERRDQFNAPVQCRCDCGTAITVARPDQLGKKIKSCGCWRADRMRELSTQHGMSRSKIYGVHRQMVARCSDPQHPNYADYGARGIYVCDRWLEFPAFLADMGEPLQGRSLDRIDNDGPYTPDNCRWATPVQQNANRRPTRTRGTCRRGHLFTPENTMHLNTGKRRCKTCAADYQRQHRRGRHGWIPASELTHGEIEVPADLSGGTP